MLAVGELLRSCLEGVRLDLSTAPAIGSAVSGMVASALGPALMTVLPGAVSGPVDELRAALLAALLTGYGAAVR